MRDQSHERMTHGTLVTPQQGWTVVSERFVQRSQYDVEPFEYTFGKIEASIFENVYLTSVQDGHLWIYFPKACDLVSLPGDAVDGEIPGCSRGGRVVGDGDVLVSEANSGADHRLDRIAAVAP